MIIHIRVYCLQHVAEEGLGCLEAVLSSFSDELIPSDSVQAADEILSRQFNTQLNEKFMFNLLDKMVSRMV